MRIVSVSDEFLEQVTSSQLLQDSLVEKAEDVEDLAELRAAMAADDGKRFSLTEVRAELGL